MITCEIRKPGDGPMPSEAEIDLDAEGLILLVLLRFLRMAYRPRSHDERSLGGGGGTETNGPEPQKGPSYTI